MNDKTIDLKEYLKTAQDLESSVYRQREAIEKAKSIQGENNPQNRYQSDMEAYNKKLESIEKIKNRDDGPSKPAYVSQPEEVTKNPSSNTGIYYLLLMISFFIPVLGLNVGSLGLFIFGIISIIAIIVAFRVAVVADRKEVERINARNREDYSRALKRREEEFQAAKKEALDKKNKLICTQEAAADTMKQKLEQRYSEGKEKDAIAAEEIAEMENELSKTEKLLEQLYEKNVVYPKYRNMAAMCTIYEYFASGRCDKLEGYDGAYNLYEAEIRQNIIIVSLLAIKRDLEKIRENQYQLYQQMELSNLMVYNVGLEMNKIYETTQSIEKTTRSINSNSYLSAQYAKITAVNSEALKYINLINS